MQLPALNASLVILDTKTAIENRIFCLLLGIVIVILIYMLAYIARAALHMQRWSVETAMAVDQSTDRDTAISHYHLTTLLLQQHRNKIPRQKNMPFKECVIFPEQLFFFVTTM